MAAFDYEEAKAKYGAQRARQMQQEAKAAQDAAPAAPAAGAPSPAAPAKHLSETTPEEAGIAAWGTEIGDENRQSSSMNADQRARWAMEHIESFDAQSKNPRSRAEALEQWKEWDKHYDESCPPNQPYRNEQGDCAEKPDDCSPGTTKHGNSCVPLDQLPEWAGGTGGGGGGGGGGQYAPAAPPPPSTFGSQLSYTGNPLTDMLLYQFNTGAQISDPSKMNTFAMGEDRQEGGTGAAADQGKRTGQLLQGGGLWWQGEQQEKGADAFGGFRADTANSNAANPLSMANKPATPAAAAPTPQAIASPPPAAGTLSQPSFAQTPATGMSGMLGNSFKPQSWRNKAAGAVKNPLEVQAF